VLGRAATLALLSLSPEPFRILDFSPLPLCFRLRPFEPLVLFRLPPHFRLAAALHFLLLREQLRLPPAFFFLLGRDTSHLALPRQYPFERADQPLNVLPPALVAEVESLPARERLKSLGQVLRAWHLRALHQHGYHPHVAREGRGNLHAHEVVRVVEPPPRLVPAREPTPPYQREQNLARTDGSFDDMHEVFARLDLVQIHKNLFVAEVRAEAFTQGAGVAAAIFAPVADEDA
jgi:hypothetical protein